MQCQTKHSSSYAVTFSLVEKYVWSRRVSIPDHRCLVSDFLFLLSEKLNVIGTEILLRTLKWNVRASMVPWPQSKWRRRHKWALTFFFSTYRWPYVGRDLCQVRCYRKCQKGHSRTQWPLVWWTTSICSLYLWRDHASSSIGCSKQNLRRYPTKKSLF